MSIGPDIKQTLADVGQAYTIIRDAGNVTGEYTFYQGNAQVTKPFIREFFLECWLSYDTEVVVGDIVKLNTTSARYFVMNKSPDMLENAVFRYQAVLYKTNVTCDIRRPTSPDYDAQTYRRITTWSYIKESVDALITAPLYGHSLESDEELGLLGLEMHEMYVPTSWGVEALDRIVLSDSVYYRVETVKPRRYDGMDVLELGEDNRASFSTTTTSSSTTSSSSSSTTTTTA